MKSQHIFPEALVASPDILVFDQIPKCIKFTVNIKQHVLMAEKLKQKHILNFCLEITTTTYF